MHKYEVFCVDVFRFRISLLGRKKKRPQDARFMQEIEGQISHKVNPPDEGLVGGDGDSRGSPNLPSSLCASPESGV